MNLMLREKLVDVMFLFVFDKMSFYKSVNVFFLFVNKIFLVKMKNYT